MTTITAVRATAPPAAPLDLDARLAAVDAAMTLRLETAALAVDINSAHIETPVFDFTDIVTAPVAVPQIPETAYSTPIAALLERARQRILRDGWCANALRSTDGQRCLYGAIQYEAGDDATAKFAAVNVLLDAIRRRFPDADSVPGFNDRQTSWHVPVRVLGEAATLADAKGL